MAVSYQRRHHQRNNNNNKNTLPYWSDILKNKPFWIWDKQEHLKGVIETNQNCSFNHIVGLDAKDGKQFLLFDYENL
jgi:hypothetical protein